MNDIVSMHLGYRQVFLRWITYPACTWDTSRCFPEEWYTQHAPGIPSGVSQVNDVPSMHLGYHQGFPRWIIYPACTWCSPNEWHSYSTWDIIRSIQENAIASTWDTQTTQNEWNIKFLPAGYHVLIAFSGNEHTVFSTQVKNAYTYPNLLCPPPPHLLKSRSQFFFFRDNLKTMVVD